jgi:hypothetical protein
MKVISIFDLNSDIIAVDYVDLFILFFAVHTVFVLSFNHVRAVST